MSEPSNTPAGWYDDGAGSLRYWDGNAWTEHTAPKGSAGPPPAEASRSGSEVDAPVAPIESTAESAPTAVVPPVDSTPPAPAAQAQPYAGAPATAAPPNASASASTSAPATKPHVLGIVALIVAAIGFIFACIPGALIVGWVLLPIAFVLSIVALFLKGRKWPAIAALIVSIVGTIVGVVVFFTVVSTSFGEAFEEIDGAISEASEAPESLLDDEATEEPEPEPAGNLAFGDTMVWEDGMELAVSAPEGYAPSEFAAGADFPNNIVFTLTITNNTSENLEPTPYVRLSSGGQEASQIFDITGDGTDVGVPPTTVVLPGQSVTWQSAWSVADPSSLTMQVSPSFNYEDAIFTNVQ